ncbi:proteasome-interacting thioredoxin domain-containing protein [Cardiosporidium cionae]|uniref:Proteasome-interacting thioredoxin domain-containing protein n=1 Tax=Cardiosporidium cionae TaxID=476202 RepID=A0ABQ7JF41_9APIC|nr:proteasome-interacting thioredoxin domain-containing protein [Cardiosporidium cionae]|eukprot:KAF8822265.1 proteasome-interacting thioredoxin domain-containing protein [Cardiosporidium cionae]
MEMESLLQYVDKTKVECLNVSAEHPLANIWQESTDLYVASENDSQLLINIGFTQPVRLASVKLKAVNGGVEDGTAASILKFFINRPAMDFSQAETEAPTQSISLTRDQVHLGNVIPLRFVKFQNICNVIIFVEDNMGADITKIASLDLLGSAGEQMNMKDWVAPVEQSE